MGTTISTALPGMTLRRHEAPGTTDTDHGLLERYRSGDQTAFTVLYDRYRGPLRRFVARLTRSR
jgi:hypothetical protein